VSSATRAAHFRFGDGDYVLFCTSEDDRWLFNTENLRGALSMLAGEHLSSSQAVTEHTCERCGMPMKRLARVSCALTEMLVLGCFDCDMVLVKELQGHGIAADFAPLQPRGRLSFESGAAPMQRPQIGAQY
jgi:hypothetical protein